MNDVAKHFREGKVVSPTEFLAERKATDERLTVEIVAALDMWFREHAKGRDFDVPAAAGQVITTRFLASEESSTESIESIMAFKFHSCIRDDVKSNVVRIFEDMGFVVTKDVYGVFTFCVRH